MARKNQNSSKKNVKFANYSDKIFDRVDDKFRGSPKPFKDPRIKWHFKKIERFKKVFVSWAPSKKISLALYPTKEDEKACRYDDK